MVHSKMVDTSMESQCYHDSQRICFPSSKELCISIATYPSDRLLQGGKKLTISTCGSTACVSRFQHQDGAVRVLLDQIVSYKCTADATADDDVVDMFG
jgi:hypothetical protein